MTICRLSAYFIITDHRPNSPPGKKVKNIESRKQTKKKQKQEQEKTLFLKIINKSCKQEPNLKMSLLFTHITFFFFVHSVLVTTIPAKDTVKNHSDSEYVFLKNVYDKKLNSLNCKIDTHFCLYVLILH